MSPSNPTYLIVCDDCDGEGCWKCGWQAIDGFVEGVIEITPEEADLDQLAYMGER